MCSQCSLNVSLFGQLYRNPLVNMSYMKEKEADTYFAKELLERIAAELITLLTDLENRADAHHFILYFADLIPDALQTLVPLYARYCATTEARKGFFDAVPTRKTAIEQRVAETSSKSWAKLDNIRVAIELHLVDWRKVLERLAQVMKPSHHEYQAILRALEMVKGALQYIEKWSGELAIAHEHAVARSSVRDFELLSRDYINVDSDAKHAELQTAFIHSGGIKAWEPVGGLWHVMVCATDADQTPTRSSRIFSGMHASKPKSRPAEPAILCLYTDRRFMLLRGKDLSRETTVVALGRVCFAELRQGYALAKASLPDTVKISAKCELEFSFTVIPVSAPGKTDGDFARALVRALEATKRPSGEKLLANKEWEDVARTHGWEHVTAASLELVRPVRDDSVAPRSPTKLHGHAGPSNLTPRLERKDTMSGVAGLKRAFSTRFGRGEM